MTSEFDKLCETMRELKSRGLSNEEIAEELNVQQDTVVWCMLHEKEKAKAPIPLDYVVNWSSLGSSTRRLSLIGWALADLAKEAAEKGEFEDFDTVVGVELSGCALAMVVADELGKPIAAARFPRAVNGTFQRLGGLVSSSFSSVEGNKVLLVTDVISKGVVLGEVVRSLRDYRAKPVGMIAILDKRGGGEIDGVNVKSLINIVSVRETKT